MHIFGKPQDLAFQNCAWFVCATNGSKVISFLSNPTSFSYLLSLIKLVLNTQREINKSKYSFFTLMTHGNNRKKLAQDLAHWFDL
jgi:hypothetical protein